MVSSSPSQKAQLHRRNGWMLVRGPREKTTEDWLPTYRGPVPRCLTRSCIIDARLDPTGQFISNSVGARKRSGVLRVSLYKTPRRRSRSLKFLNRSDRMASTVSELVGTLESKETTYMIHPEDWPGRYTRVVRPQSPNFLTKRMDVCI